MIRFLALSVLGFTWLAADDITLGAPQTILCYGDGSRIHHALELPAGQHCLQLSDSVGELVAVDGVQSWYESVETVSQDIPALGEAVTALLAERASLAARYEMLYQHEELQYRFAGDISLRIERDSRAEVVQVEPWQQAVEAMLERDAELQREARLLDAAQQSYVERLEALDLQPKVRGLLSLHKKWKQKTLGLDELESAQGQAFAGSFQQRVVVVDVAEAGPIVLRSQRQDCT
jgi:uncharacterized protein YueI